MKSINEIITETKKAKKVKIYRITRTHYSMSGSNREYKLEGTLDELIKAYSYTLECGKSWEHERGNKKINMNPKTIDSLCTNLYNASNNSARNGYSGDSYDWEEIDEVPETEIIQPKEN